MEQSFVPHALELVTLITFSFIGSISPDMIGENVNSNDFSGFYEYDRSLPLDAVEELLVDEDACQVYRIYFDSVNSERVPALLSIPKGKEMIPCIVFLHGYGGSKEDILSAAGPVAAEAYAVIAIDAKFHGERREDGKELYSMNLDESRNGIIQTVIDLRRAVEYLETRADIDENKIGYVGGSMGGILGAIFIAVEPKIKVAALLVAGGNMSLMIRKSNHYTMPPLENTWSPRESLMRRARTS